MRISVESNSATVEVFEHTSQFWIFLILIQWTMNQVHKFGGE